MFIINLYLEHIPASYICKSTPSTCKLPTSPKSVLQPYAMRENHRSYSAETLDIFFPLYSARTTMVAIKPKVKKIIVPMRRGCILSMPKYRDGQKRENGEIQLNKSPLIWEFSTSDSRHSTFQPYFDMTLIPNSLCLSIFFQVK